MTLLQYTKLNRRRVGYTNSTSWIGDEAIVGQAPFRVDQRCRLIQLRQDGVAQWIFVVSGDNLLLQVMTDIDGGGTRFCHDAIDHRTDDATGSDGDL